MSETGTLRGDRCTGDCCRRFYLPYSPQELDDWYGRWLAALAEGKAGDDTEIHLIAPMVRFVGLGPGPAFRADESIESYDPVVAEKTDEDGTVVAATPLHHYYTCVNLGPTGDCGIYERRPRMCREYPYSRPCQYAGCTSTAARAGKMGGVIGRGELLLRARQRERSVEMIEEAEAWR